MPKSHKKGSDSCGTCAFCIPNAKALQHLECRINAPAVFPANGPQGVAFMTKWPNVTREDWCADFMSKLHA